MKSSILFLSPILCSGLTGPMDFALCQEKCQEAYMQCVDECKGNADCNLTCNRKYVKCEESCKPDPPQDPK